MDNGINRPSAFSQTPQRRRRLGTCKIDHLGRPLRTHLATYANRFPTQMAQAGQYFGPYEAMAARHDNTTAHASPLPATPP
ncbi:hypothetical protein AZ22_1273 [Bordetella bronchiseptica 980-2]|nr:hypothetical protein AZ22_1273 [Bordetella bronchiseptica 980-2]KCV49217.1 hypothetical protein L491_0124 [Bordetella bronchiseptica 3E44]KCV55934.1 hypothetical protein AZ14_0133 [Bordetella bronchiseptica 980]KDB86501.1 hypothetical protein AZ27_0122 [Bordetella bronchiseptica D756]KDB91119.1 hypothetical protein AZ17_2839 [Bordetella bronchiseptica D989]KDC38411.1 hypothetical protein L508_0126 [Bordetella bronchiseptica M435/02/3]KDC67253.1 hypothetical protein L512_0105 [Bordetella br